MTQFLNVKTGQLYDPDIRTTGESHFTDWFEDVQSVNGIYAKRIVIVEDSDLKTINLFAPEDSKFFFIKNDDSSEHCNIDGRSFKVFEKNFVSTSDKRTTDTAVYTDYNDGTNYFYSVILFCSSMDAGTFEEEIEIDIDNSKYVFTVGADFYNEDESLTSNLENFGVEIPSIVQKALFPVNLREDLNDNISLNEKRRELLMNYLDVVVAKGSYDSLIKSLKWFGYGDLVKIREYWQRLEASKVIYVDDELEYTIDDVLESQLSYLSKTTYYGLYLLLNNYSTDVDVETNPVTKQIDDLTLRWTIEDLSIKMTLLGNFFSTYFMPIHLDLIHSTIERRCFTMAHAILKTSFIGRRDYVNCNMPMMVTTSNVGNTIERNLFYLEDTTTWTYPDTLFVNNSFTTDDIIGCEPLRTTDTIDNANSSLTARHLFTGIGKIVKFHVDIPAEYTSEDDSDCIWKETLTWNENGNKKCVSYVPKYVVSVNSQKCYRFDFYVLFTDVRKYNMKIEFETLSRKVYTCIKNLEIRDGGANDLEVYRVVRVSLNELYNNYDTNPPISRDTVYNLVDFNNFSFCNTPQTTTDGDFRRIRLITSDNTYRYRLGRNHILRFKLEPGMKIKDSDSPQKQYVFPSTLPTPQMQPNIPQSPTNNELNTLFKNNNIDINAEFNRYWWDVRWTYTDTAVQGSQTIGAALGWVVTGIRKAFTLNNNNGNTVDVKRYSIDGSSFNVKVEALYDGSDDYFKLEVTTQSLPTGYVLKASAENEYSHTYSGGVSRIYVPTNETKFNLKYELFNGNNKVIDLNNVIRASSPTSYFKDGMEEYRAIVYDSSDNMYEDRIINEDRFIPAFHKLVTLEEPYTVSRYETIAIVPRFRKSYNLSPSSVFNWQFRNRTTGTVLQQPLNHASVEPFVETLNTVDYEELGYVDVELQVRQEVDGNVFSEKMKSAYKIE